MNTRVFFATAVGILLTAVGLRAQGVVVGASSDAWTVDCNASFGIHAEGDSTYANGYEPVVEVVVNLDGQYGNSVSGSNSYLLCDSTATAASSPTTQYVNAYAYGQYGSYAQDSAAISVVSSNHAPVGSFDGISPSTVVIGQDLSGSGWAADYEMGAPVDHVDVQIDGTTVMQATLGGARTDVQTANTSWGNWSPKDITYSGWNFTYNTASLSVGSHSVTIIAWDNQGASTNLGTLNFTAQGNQAPSSSLSASATNLTIGDSLTLTSTITDPDNNLQNQAVDISTDDVNWTSGWNNWSGTTGWNISGGSDTRTITYSPPAVGTYYFRSRGQDTLGALSAFAYITVTVSPPPAVAPAITWQPRSITVDVGQPASFSVTATGTAPLGYQWRKNGTNISGATGATYTIPAAATSDAGSYSVVVTNVAGSATSENAILSVYDPNADDDGDGMPNWWETEMGLNPNDPSDASADPDGDGVTNLDEYNSWRDPRVKDLYNQDLTVANVEISVIAKGTGTVTLTATDETNTQVGWGQCTFSSSGSTWTDGDQGGCGLRCNLGETYHITITSSGVTDYVIATKLSPQTSPLLQAVVELNGSYTDRILMSEISGGSITVSVIPEGSLPFGKMDDSKFETQRMLSFGLGGSSSGQTPGRILFTSGSLVDGSWRPALTAIKGPALEWYHQTPTHFQGKTAGGYVEFIQTRAAWTVNYYPPGSPGQYPDGAGFNDFTGATPSATYEIDLSSSGMTLKRTIGDVTQQFEDQTQFTEVHQSSVPPQNSDPGEDYYLETGTERNWGWHTPGSPTQGLTEVVATVERIVLTYGTGPVTQYGSPDITITDYDGSTDDTAVKSRVEQMYAAGDLLLQSKTSEILGTGADTVYGNYQFTIGTALQIGPICAGDPIGDGTYTEYYSRPTNIGSSDNLDGQPVLSYAEVKYIYHSFGNEPGFISVSGGFGPATGNPVTTYTYLPDPVDGRAAVGQEITTMGIGGVTIAHTDYAYDDSGSLNDQKYITTTATEHVGDGTSLVTISKAYSRRIVDLDLRGKPISVQHPDGTKVSYAYQRGTLSGADWTADANGSDLLVAELNGKSGSTVTAYSGVTIDPLDMDPTRSTVTERIVNGQGLVLREATFVYTGGGFSMVNAIYYGYTALGALVMKADQPVIVDTDGNPSTSGRILYEASYDGWRKLSESDDQGVTFSYTYDDYGRVQHKTRAQASGSGTIIAAATTTYTYDGAGRCLTETVSTSGAGDTLVTSYGYDTADRLVSRTLPGNFTTSFAYSSSDTTNYPYADNVTTTTFPDGGTKVQILHRDGTQASVTGSAVPDVGYTYAFDGSGYLDTTETMSTGQSTVTVSDWLGRTRTVSTATWSGGTRLVTDSYNSSGQLSSQDTTSGGTRIAPKHLYQYDDYGRLSLEALDPNAGDTIDVSNDFEVKGYEFAYQQGAPGCATSDWYRYDGQKIWPYDGANAGTYRYSSQSYTQLSGLTLTTVAHTVTLDFDRNRTESTSTLDRADAQLTVNTTATGTSQTLQTVTLDGLVVSSTNAQGQTTTMTYDGFGRKLTSTDPRIGATTFAYSPGTTLVQSATPPDGRATTYTYDAAGRVNSTTDHAGKVANFQYDQAGNLLCQWGDTVDPVRYEYNDLGQRTYMHTFRSGGSGQPDFGGDVTTWNYQASTGLLVSKVDATNAAYNYQYNDLGQMSKRIDARSVATNYSYNSLNLLQTVSYTDGVTPTIGRTYDRTGKLLTVTDAAGTRTFAYYDSWTNSDYESDLLGKSAQLKSETLPSTFFGNTNNVLDYDYQYQVAGRANGPVSSVTIGPGSAYSVSYGYDDVLRLNSITYNGGTAFAYTYVSGSNLVHTVGQSGGYWRDYEYCPDSDRLYDLTHGMGNVTSSFMETRLTYDAVGRRNTEKTQGTGYMTALGRTADPGIHVDYSYTDRSELDSSAKYVLNADWSVGSLLGGTGRDYEYDSIGNRDATYGYTPNNLNQYTVAPGFGTFTYDANGNMTGDGVRTYAYDAENRLIKVTQGAYTWNYVYDYLGRRIEKSGSGIATTKYLYDSWDLIAELDDSGNIQNRYVWGIDASGSLSGAGGVGGLLLIDAGSAQYWPVYDASDNVIALYDSGGGFAAAYEYDPFGNLQTAQGSYVSQNVFLWSTKYTDGESGLVYYGMRYYSPQLGRFINRDPIGEADGANLYAYCGNDGVDRFDILGQDQETLADLQRKAEIAAQKEAEDKAAEALFHPTGFFDSVIWSAPDNGLLSYDSTKLQKHDVVLGAGYKAGEPGILVEDSNHTRQWRPGDWFFSPFLQDDSQQLFNILNNQADPNNASTITVPTVSFVTGTPTLAFIPSVTAQAASKKVRSSMPDPANPSGLGFVVESIGGVYVFGGGGGGSAWLLLDNGTVSIYIVIQAGFGVGGKAAALEFGPVGNVHKPSEFGGSFLNANVNFVDLGISVSNWPNGAAEITGGVAPGAGGSANYQYYIRTGTYSTGMTLDQMINYIKVHHVVPPPAANPSSKGSG